MRKAWPLVLLVLLASQAGCQNGGLFGKPFTVPDVRIEGNRQVKDQELLDVAERDLQRFMENDRRLADADDAAFTMEVSLREQGFPKARVHFEARGGEVVFHVEEGPKTVFQGVCFRGVRPDFVEELEPFFEFPGSGFLETGPALLDRARAGAAISRMKTFYLRRGFLEVKVKEPQVEWCDDQGNARVLVTVEEGPQYHVASVTIEGVSPSYIAGHDLVGKPHDPAVPFRLAADTRRKLRNEAYLFAETDVKTTLDEENATASIHVTAQPGVPTRLRRLCFPGSRKVKDDFMRNRFELTPGCPVTQRAVESGTAELYRSRIFASIEPRLQEIAPGWADIDVQVEEGESKRLEVGGGWGSWDQLWGSLTYKDFNVFGRGRVLRAETIASLKTLGAELQLEDPWILGIDNWIWITLDAVRREERFYTYTGFGAELAVERRFNRNNRVVAGYRFRIEEASDVAATIPPDELAEVQGFQRSAGLFFTYRLDFRDDLFLPTKGIMAEFGAQWSTSVLGASLDYIELEARTSYHIPFGNWSSLALGVFFGTRSPYNGTVMPIQRRYFLGGAQSVRSFGYEELTPTDPFGKGVGGLTAVEAHIEWRPRIHQNFYGALFADAGQVSLDAFSFDADIGWGVGAGLRYYTPVGPVRLDAAYNPGPLFAATQRWQLHFSFGFSF